MSRPWAILIITGLLIASILGLWDEFDEFGNIPRVPAISQPVPKNMDGGGQ